MILQKSFFIWNFRKSLMLFFFSNKLIMNSNESFYSYEINFFWKILFLRIYWGILKYGNMLDQLL